MVVQQSSRSPHLQESGRGCETECWDTSAALCCRRHSGLAASTPCVPMSTIIGKGGFVVACLPLLSLKWMPSMCTARGGSIPLVRLPPCSFAPLSLCPSLRLRTRPTTFRPSQNIYRAPYFLREYLYIHIYFSLLQDLRFCLVAVPRGPRAEV